MVMLGLFLPTIPATAQDVHEEDSIARSYTLQTLFVTEKYITKEKEVNIGAKTQTIPAPILEVFQSRSLADLLIEQTGMVSILPPSWQGSLTSLRCRSSSLTRSPWSTEAMM